MRATGDRARLNRIRRMLDTAKENGPLGDQVFLLRLLDEALARTEPEQNSDKVSDDNL